MSKWDFFIDNHTKEDLDNFEELAKRAFLTTIEVERIENQGELSLVFVDDAQIKEMNKAYRGKDEATDVLSFPQYDQLDEGFLMLGDIVISIDTARKQAESIGHSLEREVAFLTVHGTLHLLGYDHNTQDEEDEMTALQELILVKMGLGV